MELMMEYKDKCVIPCAVNVAKFIYKFRPDQRLCDIREVIGKHLQSRQHLDAFEEREKELRRNVRRTWIGLNIARDVLQTLREGSSYVQFEMKLRDMHLAGLDIGFMNHSREFIRKFVESMVAVMDRRVGSHLKAVDPIITRKRVFSFMADKVTKLHRTRDVVALLVMSEEGVLQSIFADYLLVTRHTGEALMNQIYKDTFITKLGLTPAKIMAQCNGAAFDGQYFNLNCLEALAKRMIEGAKGGPASTTEV
jgi:hypothetical protein